MPKKESRSKGWHWTCALILLITAVLLAGIVYFLTPEEQVNAWETYFHDLTGWH